MMDPPIKLFGQTIAFTTSASSQDDALDGAGTTSTGAWEELPSSPQDVQESGAESGAKSELTMSESPASCFPEFSSAASSGAEEEKNASSPREIYGLVLPSTEVARGRAAEDSEDLDLDDLGLGHGEGTTSQEGSGDDPGSKGPKMPRRPDKAVACPRCHSLETKFCYYNNYNVKQPRHFCKHCQRYWTAGGTLRNVPVGAGRRKNKHGSVISPRQTPETGLVRGDEPDVAAPLLGGKGVTLPVPMSVPVVQTVLGGALGCSAKPVIRVPVGGGSSDGGGTLPYTMRVPSLEGTYILTSSEATKSGDTSLHGGNLPRLATPGFKDVTAGGTSDVGDGSRSWHSKDDSTCAAFIGPCGAPMLHDVKGESGVSSEYHKEGDVTAAWNSGGAGGVRTTHGATGPFGFFNGGWPYGFNVGWSGGAAFCAGGVSSSGNAFPPPTPASIAAWSGAAAGNMWTGIPWPMPDMAWSPAGWPPPPWSISPWAMGAASGTVAMPPSMATGGAAGLPTPTPCPTGTGSSSSLGTHGRGFEGGPVGGAVWAPKSLRMADPEEAMRSSVWRILGVGSRPDVTTPSTFKAFQPKTESKKISDDEQQTVQATLHANPAAMSRSMYFHESN